MDIGKFLSVPFPGIFEKNVMTLKLFTNGWAYWCQNVVGIFQILFSSFKINQQLYQVTIFPEKNRIFPFNDYFKVIPAVLSKF